MQLVPEGDFARWRENAGIGAHPRFPLNLAFDKAPDFQASWLPSGRVTDLPGFLQTAVSLASAEDAVLLCRKGGGSWYEGDDAPIGNHIIDRVLEAVGVPHNFQGALAFEASEWRDLYLVVGTFAVWGWSVGEDLYIVPRNGSCMLMTSHHGELFGTFPTAEALGTFRVEMENSGHPAR
jgi:hypothetical protein